MIGCLGGFECMECFEWVLADCFWCFLVFIWLVLCLCFVFVGGRACGLVVVWRFGYVVISY